MAAPRRIYGLCSVDDPTIVYVGSTSLALESRRLRHLRGAGDTDSPVALWVRSVGGRSVRIVLLHEHGSLEMEREEIARRVARGEQLLNVRDGGRRHHTARAALLVPSDAERHSSVSETAVTAGCPALQPDASDSRACWSWRAIKEAARPVVPREPLHPYNRTPSQVAALAAKRAARVAHREAA